MKKCLLILFEKFPSLLKNNKKLKDLIERERTILKNESSTKKWKESLEEAMEDISKEIGKIITRRQDEIYPELENTKGQDLSNNDLEKLLTVNYEITNKILEAKYKESPQWKRIEKIYNSIKESFYKVIDQRNITTDLKNKLKSKIKSVDLSLPYSDPRLLSANLTCQSTENNAYYTPKYNKFTVCAGMMNAFQSDSTLTSVIAHELAHSIDPERQRSDKLNDLPLIQGILEESNNGEIKDCSKWNQFFSKVPEIINSELVRPTDQMENFTRCLLPNKKELLPMDNKLMTELSFKFTDIQLSYFSTYNLFSQLATEKVFRKGKEISNEVYLNPVEMRRKSTGFLIPNNVIEEVSTEDFFVAAMKCDGKSKDPRIFNELSKEQKNKIFQESINRARDLNAMINKINFNETNNENGMLISERIADQSSENFADWMSAKVIADIMKSKDDKQKYQVAQEMVAVFCDEPENKFDDDFMILEKKYSRESHGNNKIRRLSYMNKEISTMLGCFRDEESIQGFGLCEL